MESILNDHERRRFVYAENPNEAVLGYRLNRKRLVLVHTEVPAPLGGRGIGLRLVRAAVEHARTNGETIVPWCPFARKWLQDHADDVAGVAIDWTEPPRKPARDDVT
jgi:predicted GNAT family acetyltransferase